MFPPTTLACGILHGVQRHGQASDIDEGEWGMIVGDAGLLGDLARKKYIMQEFLRGGGGGEDGAPTDLRDNR
jgi:hypothetical protein